VVVAKVYVSSTLPDLTRERLAVLDWLRLARHQAVDSYLPDSDTVRESCLDDVGTCDLYVLIVGHRYGFQPADSNRGGLSITHLEFRRAGDCGIPRVVLLRTSIPDVRLSDLEDPARAPLVLAFRKEVARQVRPAEFSDLQGLIQGLSTGIQGELDKQARRDERQAGPVAASRALRLAPRPVFLAGREELLAELDARLAGDDEAGPRVVALTGLGGAGKTSVALELAGVLGGLPLALEQAAAHVQACGDSLSGYLASFRQRRPEMLRRGEPIGYPDTVATTWQLAFEDVQHAAPGAAGLLRLLAFCAPEAVPLRLLLQPRPGSVGRLGEQVAAVLAPLLEDPLPAGDAIGALRRYSLVTLAAGGSVLVHRLIQAVTADQMPAELAGDWRHAAAALIEAAIPADTEPPVTWPVCAALLPHAQVGLADDSDGMARIANYLGRSGSYVAARDLLRKVVEARERVLGPEHPGTLTARHELARWTGAAGDPAAARDLFAALLPVHERVLGAEHPDTQATRSNLADLTARAGDPNDNVK
jgi:hypothetical protein